MRLPMELIRSKSTGEYGVQVWLQTTDREIARKLAKQIVELIKKEGKKA